MRKISKITGPQWLFIFSTSQAEIKLKMPELHVTAPNSAPFQVIIKKRNYNVIFGRDLLQELGI